MGVLIVKCPATGRMFSTGILLSRGRERDLPGFQAVHPVPLPRSRTPAESTIPRLFVGFVNATPPQTTAKASASWLYRGYRGASAPVAYASRMVLRPSMQSSLPAGWLAFTGRELNPLDRDEGFQITSSSSLPGLFLAQRPKTFTTRDIPHPSGAQVIVIIWELSAACLGAISCCRGDLM